MEYRLYTHYLWVWISLILSLASLLALYHSHRQQHVRIKSKHTMFLFRRVFAYIVVFFICWLPGTFARFTKEPLPIFVILHASLPTMRGFLHFIAYYWSQPPAEARLPLDSTPSPISPIKLDLPISQPQRRTSYSSLPGFLGIQQPLALSSVPSVYPIMTPTLGADSANTWTNSRI